MLISLILFAIITHWVAYIKGYFVWPKEAAKIIPPVKGLQVLLIFGTYLLSVVIIFPFLVKFTLLFLQRLISNLDAFLVQSISLIQFAFMLTLFIVLTGLMRRKNPETFQRVWKDYRRTHTSSKTYDFFLGAATWLLGFPLVTVIGELLDTLFTYLFKMGTYEQTAVTFVKKAAASPLSLTFTLMSVIILAPLTEEFLFRGTLQTYLKQKLGGKAAILFTALVFSLFHYASSQGLGNISLIFSLFILGCYLGFLYEKQGSLYASIGLHMTFNAISAFKIAFSP